MTFDGGTARPAQRQDGALIDASVRNMNASWCGENAGVAGRKGSICGDLRARDEHRASEFDPPRGVCLISFQRRNARVRCLAAIY
jgi:hypothetical protein